MKKHLTLQLSIPEPCTQAWEDMQPFSGGRHCTGCQKTVVDFTRMTDAQLLDYFQKPGGTACGRFTAEQLERTIRAVEVPRSTWWARVAACLLLALGLSKNVSAQNKSSKEHLEQQLGASATADSAGAFEIYGILKDEDGNPIISANVQLSHNGIMVGKDITDFDGNYKIRMHRGSDAPYEIKFAFQGKDLTITGIPCNKPRIKVNGTLRIKTKIGGTSPKVFPPLAKGECIFGVIVPYVSPSILKSGNKLILGTDLPPGFRLEDLEMKH